MNVVVRKAVTSVHRWTGMTIGLVLVFIAVTGASIAYRPLLEPMVARDLMTGANCSRRVSLDTLLASARAVHPQGSLDLMHVPAASGAAARIPAMQFRFKGRDFSDTVYLDACDGRVLGTRPRFGGVFGTIEQLHRFRFVDGLAWIPGVVALSFATVMAMLGLYLWWPRGARRLTQAIRLDGRLRGRGRTIDRHRVVGLYAGAIVLVSAVTGLTQAYAWADHVVHWISASPGTAKTPASIAAGGSMLSPDVAWTRIVALLPEAGDTIVRFPSKPDDPIEAWVLEPGASHANARSIVDVDAYTGRALRVVHYDDMSRGDRAVAWMLSWHTGEIGGPFGPLVLMIGALAVPFLAWTGISSYLRRRPQRTSAVPAT